MPGFDMAGLRMIHAVIACGGLEGDEHADRRAKLVDARARLALDPASPVRDKLQACQLLAASMTAVKSPDARWLVAATPAASPT
jgi:hypothetical protein